MLPLSVWVQTSSGRRTAKTPGKGFGVGHMYDFFAHGASPHTHPHPHTAHAQQGSDAYSVASQETLETLDDGVQQQTRRRQQQQAFAPGRPATTRTAGSGASQASPFSVHSPLYSLSPSDPTRSMLNGLSSEEYNRREAEAFLAVLRRQSGLKPLTGSSQPMTTKSNPYGGSPSAVAGKGTGSTVGALMAPHSNEPLFRKARLAQHLKEMVKVPATDSSRAAGAATLRYDAKAASAPGGAFSSPPAPIHVPTTASAAAARTLRAPMDSSNFTRAAQR